MEEVTTEDRHQAIRDAYDARAESNRQFWEGVAGGVSGVVDATAPVIGDAVQNAAEGAGDFVRGAQEGAAGIAQEQIDQLFDISRFTEAPPAWSPVELFNPIVFAQRNMDRQVWDSYKDIHDIPNDYALEAGLAGEDFADYIAKSIDNGHIPMNEGETADEAFARVCTECTRDFGVTDVESFILGDEDGGKAGIDGYLAKSMGDDYGVHESGYHAYEREKSEAEAEEGKSATERNREREEHEEGVIRIESEGTRDLQGDQASLASVRGLSADMRTKLLELVNALVTGEGVEEAIAGLASTYEDEKAVSGVEVQSQAQSDGKSGTDKASGEKGSQNGSQGSDYGDTSGKGDVGRDVESAEKDVKRAMDELAKKDPTVRGGYDHKDMDMSQGTESKDEGPSFA